MALIIHRALPKTPAEQVKLDRVISAMRTQADQIAAKSQNARGIVVYPENSSSGSFRSSQIIRCR